MRNIKFRVWDKSSKIMGSIRSIRGNFSQFSYVDYHPLLGLLPVKNREICHVELLQFTGLKDKYGVEIYEGDVISIGCSKTHPELDLVVVCRNFDTAAFACRLPHEKEPYSDHLFGINSGEVIGNIYENPELLEQQS